METHLRSPQGKEVVIGDNLPTILIGERINPFGKGPIKEAMMSGDLKPIREEALRQVEAGADILIISVAAFGIDEEAVLPRVTEEVIKMVDVPLCLESRNPVALEKEDIKIGVRQADHQLGYR
jgi:5-methyltetrahydrofolate--homocysteine methyltransferase